MTVFLEQIYYIDLHYNTNKHFNMTNPSRFNDSGRKIY